MNSKKKKKCFTIIKKYIYIYMDNLHFIPNNILTIFLKKVNKIWKWQSIIFKLSIYILIGEAERNSN